MSDVLTRTVVEIVAKGFDKVQSALTSISRLSTMTGNRIGLMSAAFSRASGSVASMGQQALAIFGTRAMAGTVEAKRFSLAMERLFRVTGNAFAPYVRFATEQIIKLTHWFDALPESIKKNITFIAVLAAGFGVGAVAVRLMASTAAICGIALNGLAAAMAAVNAVSMVFGGGIGFAGKGVAKLGGGILTLVNPVNWLKGGFGILLGAARGLIGAFSAILSPTKMISGAFTVIRSVFAGIMSPLKMIGSLFGVLGGGLSVLTGPIGIIITLVSLLFSGIVKLPDSLEGWITATENVLAYVLMAWEGLVAAWDGTVAAVGSAWEEYGQPILDSVIEAWNSLSENVSEIMTSLGEQITEFFGMGETGASAMAQTLGVIYETFLNIYDTVAELTSMTYEGLKPGFDALYEVLVELGTYIMDIIRPAIEGIGTAFSGVYNAYIKPVIDMIQENWGKMAGNLSFTWKDTMKFFKDVLLGAVLAISEGINFVVSIFTVSIGKIVEGLAWVAEKTGVLGTKTVEAMKKYGKEMKEFRLIDTTAMTERLGKASNDLNDKFDKNQDKAKEFVANFDQNFGEVFERNADKAREMVRPAANMIRNMVKDWNKADRGGGFHRGGEVKMESSQSTFDRIMQAMADPTLAGVEIEKAQLEQQKQMNANLMKIGGNLEGFRNIKPAVAD